MEWHRPTRDQLQHRTAMRNWSRGGHYPYDEDYRPRFRRRMERDQGLYLAGEHWDRGAWHSRPVPHRPYPEYTTFVHTDLWVPVKEEVYMRGGHWCEFTGHDSHMQVTVAETNSEVHQRVSRKVSTDDHVAYGAHDDKVKVDTMIEVVKQVKNIKEENDGGLDIGNSQDMTSEASVGLQERPIRGVSFDLSVTHGTHKKGDQMNLKTDMFKAVVKEEHVRLPDCHDQCTVSDTSSSVHEKAFKSVFNDQCVADETCVKQKCDQVDLKTEVLQMIVKDLHPLHLVEETGFRALVKALNPSGKIPSNESSIRSELHKIYEDKKMEIMKVLNCSEHIVLTADMWQRSSEDHMTVSCHFIDEQWIRKSYILETVCLLKGHCADSVVASIAKAWGIDEKISVLISNLPKMKKNFQKRGWHEMPCFTHILGTMFETATTLVWGDHWRDLLRKCNNIMNYISGEQDNVQKFKEHQGILPKYWPLDESWPSALLLIKWILGQLVPIKASLIGQGKSEIWISTEEEKKLIQAYKVLRVFKDATNHMEKDYYSISEILPLLLEIHGKLTKLDIELAMDIAKKCEKHIFNMKQSRWLTFSTVLDPRFKMSHLPDQIESAKEEIVRELMKITSTMDNKEKSFSNSFKSVLDSYLQEGPLPEEKNILEFWKFQRNLTDLTPLARKYLTVVSTSLPCERAFRSDIYIRQKLKRSCLHPEDVNMMLFLQGNLTVD